MIRTALFLLSFILFIGCSKEPKGETLNRGQDEHSYAFMGTWKSVKRSYPYQSHLIIGSDRKFYFEFGACMSKGFSEGVWQINDSVILMNSNKIDSCMYLSHFGVDCIAEIEEVTTEYHIEMTIPNCKPENWGDFIEFKNEKFYLDKDTLKHLFKESKICPEIKNDFLKERKNSTTNNT